MTYLCNHRPNQCEQLQPGSGHEYAHLGTVVQGCRGMDGVVALLVRNLAGPQRARRAAGAPCAAHGKSHQGDWSRGHLPGAVHRR